ncbi:hypothetical protein C2845_PM08G05170 [Panicum miliaceum]|uniref:Very-long-chain (3R)-3-hydroxyacyl-CoA dehydratase n=1 Tax=Panicum miliaceum TaxID=4540 RepID=A0A3L6R095_PANMI|nr:hypothetical protein C2845_PM08G05170 [Panicum miliaceum]
MPACFFNSRSSRFTDARAERRKGSSGKEKSGWWRFGEVNYDRVQVLYYTTLTLLAKGHESVYEAVEQPLLFAQTAALLEIFVLQTHSHVLVTSLVLSWSITEVIRYSFFGLKEAFGIIPYWHLWLRYSTFFVFYPIGLVSELGLVYAALPSMKASGKYCLEMPDKWNFSFSYYYFCIILSILYIPDWGIVRILLLSVANSVWV